MPVLVDGFNLLHAARDAGPDEAVGQLRLCEWLAAWSQARRELVTVVFDGAQPPRGYAQQLRQTGIHVLHSGAGRPADDLIIEEIRRSTAPRRLRVVSSDRQIRKAARARGCRDSDSLTFFRQMWRGLHRKAPSAERSDEPPSGLERLSREERDSWLREFGFAPERLPEAHRQEPGSAR
ncbi:MAG: hypothetical protein AMXMBFR13_39370 [Phycisphaerae bacterium]